jgi:uncharacterized protein (DUF58 family)
MIVPNKIIFWLALLTPFAAAAVYVDFLAVVGSVFAFAIILMSVVDAVAGLKNLKKISMSSQNVFRISVMRKSVIKLEIRCSGKGGKELLVSPDFPENFHPSQSVKSVNLNEENAFLRTEWECEALERGIYRIPSAVIESDSPVGLWKVRRKIPLDCEIRAYPNLRPLIRQLAPMFLSREFSGMHLNRIIGQGREFDRLREYIPGDSFSNISWKATAKRAKPISKVFRTERVQEIYAVVDAGRMSRRKIDGIAVMETYLAAALILCIVTERNGDLFGLASFDSTIGNFLKAKSGKNHYNSCREAALSVNAGYKSPDYGNLFTQIKERLRKRALIFFLTDIEDPVLAESFNSGIKLLKNHHLCSVISVKNKTDIPLFEGEPVSAIPDIYAKFAGHLNWMELETLKRSLARHGVSFTSLPPRDFASGLVSKYLEIKEKQLI